MNDKTNHTEVQDLDAFLNHVPGAGQVLDAGDRELAGKIIQMAESGVPVDTRFYHRLEQDLQSAARLRRKARPNVWPRVFASMAGAAALLVLLFLSAPRIHQMLGQPEPSAAVTLPVVSSPSIQRMTATPQPELTTEPTAMPEATSTPEQVGGWVLNATLPDGPASVPNYVQVSPGEPLTAQSALATAERLGIKGGTLYQFQGELGNTTYTISDGKQSVLFWGFTTVEFTYSAAVASPTIQESLSFDQRANIAKEWLQARGLLPEAYEILPVLTDPNRLAVLRQLEGGRMYDQNAYDPAINLTIDSAGRVTTVIYRPVQLQSTDSLPLRTAQEAWDSLMNGTTGSVAYYQTLSFEQQRSLKQWWRTYQPGAQVDVYGYASSIQAVDPSSPPLVSVSNFTLLGSADLLRQIPMRHYLHITGIYQQDAEGFAWLELQNWEQVDGIEVHLTGQFVQENGARLFKTEAGDFFTIPDVPADLADGIRVDISGARLPSGEIHWAIIQTHMEDMDRNDQFGILPVQEIPDQAGQAGPPQTGYQPGDPVEGLEALSRNILYHESDGSKTLERKLDVFDLSGAMSPWTARLSGPGAEGAENYQNLRIRVWGTYQLDGTQPVIVVDRFEPVDPDLRITPWFGKVSEATLEGKPVLLLTLDSGQQWVLKTSIRFFQSLSNNGWESGAELGVEGYPSKDPAAFGGLPVLEDMSIAYLDNRSGGHTRETYKTYLDRPTEETREVSQPSLPRRGTVEVVELVYYANSFQGPMPQEEEPRLLQPLWRFGGHLPDGRPFELLLPAAQKDVPK